MAKIIIAYLSPLSKNDEATYSIPCSEEKLTGTISSEAPIKYFLMQNPDIEKVLCIVTDKTEKSGSFEHIIEKIPEIKSKALKISFHDATGEIFEEAVLPRIIEEINKDEEKNKGDEIFLEISGGPRNAAFQIYRIANVLRFKGCEISGAAYAEMVDIEKNQGKVHDVTQSLNLDLVSGLSEFARFGDCRTLTEFYKDDTTMKPLLEAIQAFSNSLALCRTDITDKLNGINQAMRDCGDADGETKLLLEIFNNKFPLAKDRAEDQSEDPDILKLIEWCAENNLIQQALTIYNERVPGELINRGIIALNDRITADDKGNRSAPGDESHSPEYHKLRAFMRADAFYPIKLFRKLARKITDDEALRFSLCSCRDYNEWIEQHGDIEELHDKDVKDCFIKILNEMKQKYRPRQDRNSQPDAECKNCDNKKRRRCFGYERSTDDSIKTELAGFYSATTKIKFLKGLQSAKDEALSCFNENMRQVKRDDQYRYMLDHFEKAVDYYIGNNKTQLEISAMMKAVSDYMFILALRNHVCHASEAGEDVNSKYKFLALEKYRRNPLSDAPSDSADEGDRLGDALSDPGRTADEIKKAVKYIRDCSELFRRR